MTAVAITLVVLGVVAIALTFAGFAWAAREDGRDQKRREGNHPRAQREGPRSGHRWRRV